MTKLGETDDFTASQFVGEMNRYLSGRTLDWALVNTGYISQEVQAKYATEGAQPVDVDLEMLVKQGVKYLRGPFADNQTPVRHNPGILADAILSLVHYNRMIIENNLNVQQEADDTN
jgi:2-phospho-L-lactate transferase/gluconeogenesis factor (CofD/UPF0052 family)